MSIQTGVYRLAQVIKWGGMLIALVLVVAGVLSASKEPSMYWFFLVLAAIVFGVARGIAWILEGFAKG